MKKLGLITLSLALITATPAAPFAAGWIQGANGAWFYDEDNGIRRHSTWIESGGAWYYLGADGRILTDTTTPDGYYVGSDGKWIDGQSSDGAAASQNTQQQAAAAAQDVQQETAAAVQNTQQSAAAQETVTLGMKNALGRAGDYLEFTSFSKPGLKHQLEYEGFTSAEASYAVNHIVVDWNAQCAAKAQSYLDFSHFSRQRLKEQLEYEGFTASEIAYGLQAVGY